MKKGLQRRIFLDHASTTPVSSEVLRAMGKYWNGLFQNPSSIYEEGILVKNIVESARAKIAEVICAHKDEIIFTGSGTEADNLAIFGVVEANKNLFRKPHIVTSAFEHPAILEAVNKLKNFGCEIDLVYPNEEGIVEPETIKNVLKENTILVSIMMANNEIGTISPLREIAKVIRDFRKTKKKNIHLPYFHTDASQALNYLDVNVVTLHADFLTLDASKIYGPKGIGLLYARRGTKIAPQIVGGGQEFGLRSGTENVPLIVGFAKAIEVAVRDSAKESKRLLRLRDWAIKEIQKNHKYSKLNGSQDKRLPNNINICFPKIDAEFAVLKLDALGFAISSSSSCRTLSENASSYVIEAIGGGAECKESSLRFTLGRGTTLSEMKKLCKVLRKII